MSRKNLDKIVPEGVVVTSEYLSKNGINRFQKDYYLRSGKLESIYRGVYRRPGPIFKWESIVYSLCMMGYKLHVGGTSALEKHGLSHYLRLSGRELILLYKDGGKTLPNWLDKITLKNDSRIEIISKNPFPDNFCEGIEYIPFGTWDWDISYSSAERALIEMLNEVKDEVDFEFADKFFESAIILRPKLVQTLLENCLYIKPRRLFLWFAERHVHQWVTKLKIDRINLGKGKLHIISGGVLNKKYNIIVPENIDGEQIEPLF